MASELFIDIHEKYKYGVNVNELSKVIDKRPSTEEESYSFRRTLNLPTIRFRLSGGVISKPDIRFLRHKVLILIFKQLYNVMKAFLIYIEMTTTGVKMVIAAYNYVFLRKYRWK